MKLLTLLLALLCGLPSPSPRPQVVTLQLHGEVSGESVDALQEQLQEAVNAHPRAIVLDINSPGGSVPDGFRLAQTIESSPVPVVCVVDGEADSMAAYILESCQIRVMTKRSVLMFHEPAIGVNGFQGQQTAWGNIAAYLHAQTLAMAEHVCRRMHVTPEAFVDRIRGGAEWWMAWQEAQQLGAVDLVVDSSAQVQL